MKLRLCLTMLAAAVVALLPALPVAADPLPGGTLDPLAIPKFTERLVVPPAMPRTSVIHDSAGGAIDYYEIAMKQFRQYILPRTWSKAQGIAPTMVWGYGSMTDIRPASMGGTLNYPAFTIEAKYGRPVRVKWINGLVDAQGHYLPHLFAVDQTLHWANPGAGPGNTDSHGMDATPYTGPVPMVTHVHGAHTTEDSDGFPEAWFLPAAGDLPAGYATEGSMYAQFKAEFEKRWGQAWQPGSAIFQYPNDQRAATLWYHDHTLGMTRLNVYAGPAGFYLLRGGPGDVWSKYLPKPAPRSGDKRGVAYREIPLVIQDRSFNADGSLFYPSNRAFFEGLNVPGETQQFPGAGELQIPLHPEQVPGGLESDIAPIWNPEFFGNTMVVNGKTWPYLNIKQQRYRFRFLNGSEARFLILRMSNGQSFWQVGSEGGFLPRPVKLKRLLIAPAERADVVLDFRHVAPGTKIVLRNLAPDSPFGGGVAGKDFAPADPNTTGQVMQFRVAARTHKDTSRPAAQLPSYTFKRLGMASGERVVSINELSSSTVTASVDQAGNVIFDPAGQPFGPQAAALGTFDEDTGQPVARMWADPVTENPQVGATEVWEIRNYTEDAHPIHIHMVQFQVVDRQIIDSSASPHGQLGQDAVLPPEAWETGYKDTVVVYPGELTRIKAKFDTPGLFVWHCHILEHEDNEMMRPYRVGP